MNRNAVKAPYKKRAIQLRIAYLPGIALVFLLLGAPNGYGQSIELAMKDTKDRLPTVSCTAGGRMFSCLIDTGAANTLVNDRVPHSRYGTVTLNTAIGSTEAPVASLELTVGTLKVTLPQVVVGRRNAVPCDIMLGQDFLRQFRRVTLDYKEHRVILER